MSSDGMKTFNLKDSHGVTAWRKISKNNKQHLLRAGAPSHTVFDQTKEMWYWKRNWRCPSPRHLQSTPQKSPQNSPPSPNKAATEKRSTGPAQQTVTAASNLVGLFKPNSPRPKVLVLPWSQKSRARWTVQVPQRYRFKLWRREQGSASLATPLGSQAR